MSDAFVPYHLRQNKAIDRNLFVELLLHINRYFPIKRYEYIGFGGAFLEDFKIMHAYTGIKKMISLEIDEDVLPRQKFNRPVSCISCTHKSSADFITEYGFLREIILWLDYMAPSEIGSQLQEIEALTSRLKRGDLVKVTVNANATALARSTELEKEEDLNQKRFDILEKRIGATNFPADVTPEMMTHALYPQVLYKAIKLAFHKGMEGSPRHYFQPLTSYVYADGQKMLTFTGIILALDETQEFFKKTEIKKWELSVIKDDKPLPINVPELSIKERMLLDSLLPKYSAETIQKRLKFLVGKNSEASLEGLRNYVRYYKQYPYFSKILV